MSILGQCRRTIRKIAFGDTLLPPEFTTGMAEPQSEIAVWLHGTGTPRDVTGFHTTACTAPLIICVGCEEGQKPDEKRLTRASLKFRERGGRQRILGEIPLRFHRTISIGATAFILFMVRGSRNYCLPKMRLWAHYLLQAYAQWRRTDPSDIKMSLLEQRAASVTFIRPHPLCLVSVGDRTNGNIFPMNLMGDLGNGYFGFALREERLAAHLVERAGRITVSALPLTRCSLPWLLAINHRKESIDWKELPFETRPSATFRIPVPDFAVRVREMQIEKVTGKMGSHRFFIARTVSDEICSGELQACVVHGFYQFWRLKGDSARLKASLAEDTLNKQGIA
jgi:hypothetical protein